MPTFESLPDFEHGRPESLGVLIVNLGTPSSPSATDVRRYLREFLLDPRVIDVTAWKRWLVVNAFILPFRPKESGEAYSKVWTDEGSPLLVHSRNLARKVQDRVGDEVRVELAMRYGSPSIPEAMRRYREQGIRRIVAFPLYPQYSAAATASSLEKVFSSRKTMSRKSIDSAPRSRVRLASRVISSSSAPSASSRTSFSFS